MRLENLTPQANERAKEKRAKANDKRKRRLTIPPLRELRKKYKGKPPTDKVMIEDAVVEITDFLVADERVSAETVVVTKTGVILKNKSRLEARKDAATINGYVVEQAE